MIRVCRLDPALSIELGTITALASLSAANNHAGVFRQLQPLVRAH